MSYLAKKLVAEGKFKETTSEQHLKYMEHLSKFGDIVLKYSSCTEFVHSYLRSLYVDMISKYS